MVYRCSISYRSGAINDCIHNKILFVKADSPEAAYVVAKEATKNIDKVVYSPDIEEWILPTIDIECTLENVTKEYGTKAIEEAKQHTAVINKTTKGKY